MQKKLGFVLLFLFFCSCVAYSSDSEQIEWVAAARIHNALQLWRQIISVPEIEPVYQGSAEQISALFAKQNISLPPDTWLNESIYLGFGYTGIRSQLVWALWRGDDSSREFVGITPFLTELLFTSLSERKPGMPDAVAFPEIFNRIDSQKSFHLVFNQKLLEQHLKNALASSLSQVVDRLKQGCDSNLRKMNRAIKRQQIKTLPDDMKLSCPLKGNYSFNSDRNAAVCNHIIPEVDPGSVAMNEIQMRASKFLELLGHISSFSLSHDKTSGQVVLRLEHSYQPASAAGDAPELADVLRWFDDLAKVALVSPDFNSQLVAAPDFSVIAALMAAHGPGFDGVEQFLPPPGPVNLLARGEFSMFSDELPEISLGIRYPDTDFVASAVEMFKQFGVEVEEDEIFGRKLWKLPVPDMRHSFNEQQNVERAIFIRAEADGRVAVSLNRELAQDAIAIAAGESEKIALWDDIKVPVKIAYAQTMSSVARAVLRLVNSALFEHEHRQCAAALSNWTRENRDFVSNLSHDTTIGDDILALCPRRAIVVSRNPRGESRIICAVHNFQAARLVNYQIVDVPIPDGRWLRFRLEKGNGFSQFVADIKSHGGEK